MSPQRRKTLDNDASAFVFGDDKDSTQSNKVTPAKQAQRKRSPKTNGQKSRAIDALMEDSEAERSVRTTVDLPASQHQQLTLACAQLGKSKAEIIRALVNDFLDELNQ